MIFEISARITKAPVTGIDLQNHLPIRPLRLIEFAIAKANCCHFNRITTAHAALDTDSHALNLRVAELSNVLKIILLNDVAAFLFRTK